MKTENLLTLGMTFFLAALASRADTLASYTFDYTTSESEAWKAVGVPSSLAATDIGFGNAGLQGEATIRHSPGDAVGWYVKIRSSALTDRQTTAITAGNYIDFTLTAAPGYTFSVTGLSFDALIEGSGLYIYTGAQFSTDGTNFSSSISMGPVNSTALKSFTTGILEYSDLTRFTVRLYLSQVNGTASKYLYLDNLKIDGTVSPSGIPEPSACAVIAGACGLIAVIVCRRIRICR
ncbi:hypothetical protein OpiT1DRAFT_03930 [Opitutaceae bacterium TAV1]|nr:hypothetical protein OpiT1DRAFT_03930 [Opitutaceae bacterium TAV1]